MKLKTKITHLAVNESGVIMEDKSAAKVRKYAAKKTPKGKVWHVIRRTETLSLVAEGKGA